MSIPFATVPDFRTAGQLPAGLRGAIEAQTMMKRNLANRTAALNLKNLPEAIRQKILASHLANMLSGQKVGAGNLTLQNQPELIRQQNLQRKFANLTAQEKLKELPINLQETLKKGITQRALQKQQAAAARTRSLFTPAEQYKENIDKQKLINANKLSVAKWKSTASSNIAVRKIQAKQFGDFTSNYNNKALAASDESFIINRALKILNDPKSSTFTGPVSSWSALWVKNGQILNSLFAKLQMKKFAALHNIKNQREFTKSMHTIGTLSYNRKALIKLLNNMLKDGKRAKSDTFFIHQQIKNGVTDVNKLTDMMLKRNQKAASSKIPDASTISLSKQKDNKNRRQLAVKYGLFDE